MKRDDFIWAVIFYCAIALGIAFAVAIGFYGAFTVTALGT